MQKLLTEFIGTFFLVFVIGMTVISPDAGMFAPLAIGATLMVMVYAGGHVSGGHYNPAVSFGAFLAGALPARGLIAYWIMQVVGALAAYGLVFVMKGYQVAVSMPLDYNKVLVAELLGAFALVYVVLSVAVSKKTQGNSYFGLAIGMTVMVMAYAVGGISGGAFNPAVAISMGAMNVITSGLVWVHVIANLAGGALAAMVFGFMEAPLVCPLSGCKNPASEGEEKSCCSGKEA